MAEVEPQQDVRGSHNRVAGRDYIETALIVGTPPSQLRGKVDCPTCGDCMLRAHDPGCPRCRGRDDGAARRGSLALVMGALGLIILMGLLPVNFAPSPLGQFLRAMFFGTQWGALAAEVFALGVFVWQYRRRDR